MQAAKLTSAILKRLPIVGLATASACVALSAAAAEPDAVRNAFGNTVVVVYPDGRAQKIWLHPDGGYDAIGRNGKPNSGRWSMKDDKVCLKQAKPIFIPFSYCTPFPGGGGVGASWISKDYSGTPIRLTVVKGIPAS